MEETIEYWKSIVKPATVEPTPGSINFHLDCFNESLGRRSILLSETAQCQFNNENPLTGAILSRALIETMAVQYKLRMLLDTNPIDSEKYKKIALGGRFEGFPIEQTNILTLLGKLDRKYPGTEKYHAALCEFTHPNIAGVLGSFCVPNLEENEALFVSTPKLDQFDEVREDFIKTVGTSLSIYEECRSMIEGTSYNKIVRDAI